MSFREEGPAWLGQLERSCPDAYAWLLRFVRVYQSADEAERELLQAGLATLERELVVQYALRAPARRN